MTLTEVIRGDIGGKAFRLYDVTGMSSGAVTFSAGAFGLSYIEGALYTPTKLTYSTTISVDGFPVLTTKSGTTIVLSGMAISGDAGMFGVFGW